MSLLFSLLHEESMPPKDKAPDSVISTELLFAVGKAIAKANGHPDPESYAHRVAGTSPEVTDADFKDAA